MSPFSLLLLSLTLSLFLTSPSLAARTLRAEGIKPRIVGGTEVSPHFKYPWQVALYAGGSFICGGTLINPSYVLTASHCSYVAPVDEMGVFIHRHDLSVAASEENGIYRAVSKIIMHPGFNPNSMVNDYALWKLASPVQNIDFVTLDTEGTYQVPGDDVLIMGWGATEFRGDASDVLLQSTLKIWDFSDCNAKWDFGLNPSRQMCAGVVQGGIDTCQGDSGGPILAYGPSSSLIQIGVVSFGVGCGNPNSPGVYSYVYGGLDFFEAAQDDNRTSLCDTNPCPSTQFCIASVDDAFCASFASFLAPFSFISLAFFALFFSFTSF